MGQPEMFSRLKPHILALRPLTQSALLPAVLIYTLGAFGLVCMGSTTVYLMEQSICRQHYAALQPAIVGPGGLMDEEMCKIPEIQSRVASVNGVYKVLTFMPALFLTGPYGKIAEVLGKRFILFLNLSSMTFAQLYFIGVSYFQLPIEMLYILPLFDIIGGGRVIMSSFIYGFVAESVEPKELSSIFYKLSATQLIIAFCGMSLSSWLLRSHVWVLCLIGVISISFTVPSTLLFPHTTRSLEPPKRLSSPPPVNEVATDTSDVVAVATTALRTDAPGVDSEREISETTSLLSNPSSSTTSVGPSSLSCQEKQGRSALATIFHALTTQYLKSLGMFCDIYNSSPLARIALLTYFFILIGLEIRVIFVQWASVTYGWIIADVNTLTSFEMIVSGSVLLSLPFLSRRFLYSKLGHENSRADILIVQVSIALLATGLLSMGFAPNKITYIAAVTVWTSGAGWNDSLRSFVTRTVEGNESVDKLYLGIGMIETCAGMIGTAAWSSAYAKVIGGGYMAQRSLFIAGSSVILCSLGCAWTLGRFGRKKGRSMV